MSGAVDTVAALEAAIGRTPPAMHLKVIDHLDDGARDWIARSPLAFVTAGDAAGPAISLCGGAAGFAAGEPGLLRLRAEMIDDPAMLRPGLGFGSLFLLPGIGETLRVNGRVAAVADGEVRVTVEECYGHCAKALIRSDFWRAAPIGAAPDGAAGFVAAARFMALATVDPQGRADLSPKGDPAGTMAALDADGLRFAERPGNRRADSLRNLIAQPRLAALLLIPGAARVLRIGGAARITADPDVRWRFAVNEKVPALVTGVAAPELELRDSPALARAAPWPMTAPVTDVDAAGLFLAHVKANRDRGFGARLAGTLLSLPGMDGLMRKGLEKDYRDNLY